MEKNLVGTNMLEDIVKETNTYNDESTTKGTKSEDQVCKLCIITTIEVFIISLHCKHTRWIIALFNRISHPCT